MQSETEQNNEHIVDNKSNLYKVLTAANFNLLNDIKTGLAEHNPGKWTKCKLDCILKFCVVHKFLTENVQHKNSV